MLSNFINRVKEEYQKAKRGIVVHTESFNDPIAAQISWDPLKKGGANFRTHKLLEINFNRFEVIPSVVSKIFTYIFSLVGAGAIAFFLYMLYENNGLKDIPLLGVLLFGLFFSGLALYMSRSLNTKKCFDKNEGYYWTGNKEPREVYDVNENPDFIALANIYAIQIIKERVTSDKSSYLSYELNLVCKDLTRKNVMDHSKINILREEAIKLSDFLNVPLWDGSL